MMKRIFPTVLAVSFVTASGVLAQDRGGGLHAGDAIPEVVDGKIFTAAVTDTGTEPTRIFAGEFGDSGCAPFTQNPGFNSLGGTFDPDTVLVFEASAGLLSWDGTSFVPVDTESVLVTFGGGQSFMIEDDPAGSIELGVQSDGGFHRHLDFCMNGCPDVCSPPDDADAGVYLIEWQISTQDGSLEPTEPFWFILDYLADSQDVADAQAWAEANLPAPCAGDANADNTVNLADLLSVLSNWGSSGLEGGDVNNDGIVNLADLLSVLSNWGSVC